MASEARDLVHLRDWAAARAKEQWRPEGELRLWDQISSEVGDYLDSPPELTGPALFETTEVTP